MPVFCHRIKGMLGTMLWTIVTCVDGQVSCNFHEMVPCYRQMLNITVTLHINFLKLLASLQTALVTRCSSS